MDFEIPYSLQEAIREDKVVIFIGAGLSKAAGLPLWKDIVLKVLERPGVRKGNSFRQALDDGIITPLYALDALKKDHIKEIYEQFEKSTSPKIDCNLHKIIPRITRRIITTNYDKLLEFNTDIAALDTSSTFNLQKLDELNEFILKIHGTCDSIDNAVIFTSDYEDLYGNESGLAKFQIQKIVSSYSCLFIGFSLNDNYVTSLFEGLNKLYSDLGKEHFAIAKEEIPYDFIETIKINNHEELEPLLESISNIRQSEADRPDSKAKNEDIGSSSSTFPENSEEEIYLHIGHDTPPKIENWTGRVDELKALSMQHKACFITGIGGQGKSALASKFLAEVDRSEYKYVDWRDFKEEELNFQSKLYGLIELVSDGKWKIRQLIGLETDELIDMFFRALEDKRGVFVFDNIDKYIDLQKFTPAGDMKIFFDKVMSSPHCSKFIFTCRPFIQYAGIGSYQIRLEGLKSEDTKELLKKYHQKLSGHELDSIATRLHTCTRGHPLWMGLILAQSRTDINQINALLNKIEHRAVAESDTNFSGIVSATVLEDLWKGLKERERVILRTLSISNISESEEGLANIVSKKINHNQFSKAIRSLKSLNLIVSKGDERYVELHPLVREFIRENYGKEEQESYLGLYVSYLDGFIYLFKKKFGRVLDPEDIDVIIKKIEILINAGRFQESIDELRTTCGSLLVSGYMEEYLRLTDLLLGNIQWSRKKLESLKGIFELLELFFAKSAEFDRYDLFDKYITKFSSVFQTPDTHMIQAKSALCHKAWISGDYETAIREGTSAADLMDVLGEKDIWSGRHTLHLALRETKNERNLEEALQYFCTGKTLEELGSVRKVLP